MKLLIAVVCNSINLGAADFNKAVAAIQRQVSEHLSPIWNCDAQIQPFTHINQVPNGYSIITLESLPENCFERVLAVEPIICKLLVTKTWTFNLSRIILQTVTNPFFKQFECNNEIVYSVDVCAPCGASEYEIDCVVVSDFVKPDYYKNKQTTTTTYQGVNLFFAKRGSYVYGFDIEKNKWFLSSFFASNAMREDLNTNASDNLQQTIKIVNDALEAHKIEKENAFAEERTFINYQKKYLIA